jgi:hypothetical protein
MNGRGIIVRLLKQAFIYHDQIPQVGISKNLLSGGASDF